MESPEENHIGILGAAGFLGRRLAARLLLHGRSFSCFDINTASEVGTTSYLDIECISDLRPLEGINTLVNLVAIHRDDVRPLSRYDDVNVQGAVNICEAARVCGVERIVFTSSVAIYGFAPPDTDETGDPAFFNDYGRTKYAAEQVYKRWQAEDPANRALVIVRPTVIFGEGNRGNVFNLLNQIAKKRFVMFGNGKNIKSMAYVENVAAFLEFASSLPSGVHTYNYTDGPDMDMNNLVSQARKLLLGRDSVGFRLPAIVGILLGWMADRIAHLIGRPLPISLIRVKKFLGTTHFASSISKTDFVPPVSLQEGLKRTINYEFLQDNSHHRTIDTE